MMGGAVLCNVGGSRRRVAAVAAIVMLAAALRLPGLQTVPPPLNQDEASRGYDAWAILETGADRHGQKWPLFLESFGPGDFTAALSTYITVPFIAVFGPTPLAMRLPDALLGVATVFLLYVWLKDQADATVALIAAAVLAFDPSHIALCRTAHESGFTPFLLTLALLALHRSGLTPAAVEQTGGLERRRGWGPAAWGALGGIMLGLHAWAYPATRTFTPLFCLALLIAYRGHYAAMLRGRAAAPALYAAVAGLVVGSLPLIATAAAHPERLAARAQATLLIHKDLPATGLIWSFLVNYASNLDPRYLFVSCDDMSGVFIPRVGQHMPVVAPLFIIGLARLATNWRRAPWSRLLAAWLLLYPLPAAICADWNPHPMRTVAGMTLFPVIAGLGGAWLVRQLAGAGRPARSAAALLAVIALAVNLTHFANAYYREFRLLCRAGYQTALAEAMQYVADRAAGEDFVLVTNYANQPYIYALLYQRITPKELGGTAKVVVDGRLGFHQVLRIGKYYFAPREYPEAVLRFQEEWGRVPAGAEGLVIDVARAGGAPPGEVSARFPVGDPRVTGQIMEVRRWRLPGPNGGEPHREWFSRPDR